MPERTGGHAGFGKAVVLARRVLIVDEQPLYREGVREALSGCQYFRVVGEVGNVHQALRAARHFRPQLAIVSDTLPGISGLALAETLSGWEPECAVVLVVGELTGETLNRARLAGASVVIQRSILPDELQIALSRAAPSRRDAAQPASRQEISRPLQVVHVPPAGETTPTMLSFREMEVLDCVAHGLSNKEIASELFVSEQTVKNHMTSVFKKMEVEDRVQALLFAVRHGWVTFAQPRSHTPERTSA